MWPGPYGEWGSRKYLVASCDQSLKRMGLDYVDIFYSHRFDPDTPLEETMGALDYIVRSGRALYAGISSYNSERTREAAAILKDLGTPCLIHQPSYNMLNRWVERDGLKDTLAELGIGSIAFTPLAQGMLTKKYLGGMPDDSRAAQGKSLDREMLSDRRDREHPQAERDRRGAGPDAGADGDRLGAARRRHHLGADRRVASRSQVEDCAGAVGNLDFTADELAAIDEYADEEQINLWARSAEQDEMRGRSRPSSRAAARSSRWARPRACRARPTLRDPRACRARPTLSGLRGCSARPMCPVAARR